MTASAINRTTSMKGPQPMPEFDDLPVAGTTHIKSGVMVASDASGNLVEATASTSILVLGRSEQDVDNSSGSAGDLNCRVRYGIFHWANDGASALTDADRFTLCYAKDNQTVSKDGTGRAIAGLVIDVDSTGVYVLQGPLASAMTGVSVTAGGVASMTQSIGQADLSGTTAQTIDFASALPAGAFILGVEVDLVAAFTGGGVSSLSLSVGKSGATTDYIKTLDILGSGAGYYSKGSSAGDKPAPVSASGVTVRCTLTPDGGTNMTALTAGSLTVKVFYVV